MNAGKQAIWLFLMLIGLACSGWYFASTPPKIKLTEQALSTSADMIIQNLKVRQFDAQGNLVNFLQTPYVEHTPLNNQHVLRTPRITVNQPDQSSWEIRSQTATALYGGKEITFLRDVVIHQKQNAHSPESTLTTQVITYFPQKKFATTNADVKFQQPGNEVQSKGMNAYLGEKRVQLLGQARGIYDPKHEKA
jgi:lipopolysaccharide export system protein LptC